jgi:UDP-N-acetylglucosamine:LPS N-acetylglucosamine transferase
MPQELAGCKATIGTSGLSFITEAIWLKKPFFGVPLKGEFEQTANSMFIKEAGLGDFAEHPSREEIGAFCAGLDGYRAAMAEFRFDPDAAGKALLELAGGGLARARAPAAVALGA